MTNSEKEGSNSYLSHKSFNIENLICNSLIRFEENKRESKLKNLLDRQKRIEHANLMKKMEKEIRMHNKESLERSRSRNGSQSAKKKPKNNEIRMKYWESVRDVISDSLQK